MADKKKPVKAEKPASKPVEKPAVKVEEKPVEKPTEKAVTKPKMSKLRLAMIIVGSTFVASLAIIGILIAAGVEGSVGFVFIGTAVALVIATLVLSAITLKKEKDKKTLPLVCLIISAFIIFRHNSIFANIFF
mgnify:CR=1 FL=1